MARAVREAIDVAVKLRALRRLIRIPAQALRHCIALALTYRHVRGRKA